MCSFYYKKTDINQKKEYINGYNKLFYQIMSLCPMLKSQTKKHKLFKLDFMWISYHMREKRILCRNL